MIALYPPGLDVPVRWPAWEQWRRGVKEPRRVILLPEYDVCPDCIGVGIIVEPAEPWPGTKPRFLMRVLCARCDGRGRTIMAFDAKAEA